MYQLTNFGHVIRLSDKAFIPDDVGNKDRLDYNDWLKAGNKPLPAETESPESAAKRLEAAVQTHLDSKAVSYGYDSAERCIGYINSTNPTWKAEAMAMNQWRDDVWAHCAQVQQDVASSKRKMPSDEELISELPPLTMPI